MTNPLKGKSDMIKNVVIAILVTGVVTFVAGMRYQASVHTSTQTEVKQAVEGVVTSPKE